MSQPGYGSGPYPPDNPQPGWGGPDQASNQPQSGQPAFGQPAPPPGPQPPAGPQPPSGPSFGEQPASGPGYGQPTPAFGEQPASGPGFGQPSSPPYGEPASGPGYGQPTAPFGPPSSGAGFGMPGQPNPTMAMPETPGGSRFGSEPTPKRNPWIPILAATTAVFLIVAVTMTVLFVNKNGQYNTEKSLASDRKTTITKQSKQIDKLQSQLSDTKDKLSQAKQDLTGAHNQNKDLTEEKNTIAKCLDLLERALNAAANGQTSKENSLLNQLDEPCNKAQAYL